MIIKIHIKDCISRGINLSIVNLHQSLRPINMIQQKHEHIGTRTPANSHSQQHWVYWQSMFNRVKETVALFHPSYIHLNTTVCTFICLNTTVTIFLPCYISHDIIYKIFQVKKTKSFVRDHQTFDSLVLNEGSNLHIFAVFFWRFGSSNCYQFFTQCGFYCPVFILSHSIIRYQKG